MDELGMEPLLSILESAGFPRKIPDEETAKAFNLAASLAKIQRALSIDMLVQLSIAIDPLTNRTVLSVSIPCFKLKKKIQLIKRNINYFTLNV